MKTKYLILGLFFVAALSMQAQQNALPQIQDMHAKKWEELVTAAKLSDQEKLAVYPIFLEYEKTAFESFSQYREGNKKMRNRKDGTPLEYKTLNENYIEQEVKQVEMLKKYHEQLSAILSPETLFNYYRAERAYKRNLLRNMPTHNNKNNQ